MVDTLDDIDREILDLLQRDVRMTNEAIHELALPVAQPDRRMQLFADLVLFGISVVWGFTFLPSKEALSLTGPLTYNALRFMFAGASMFILFGWRLRRATWREWASGVIVGVLLILSLTLQATGLQVTTVAKTGFITGLYVVFVPVLSPLVLHAWPRQAVWLGTMMAAVGLALLTLNDSLWPDSGDLWVLGSAISFALHILAISRFAPNMDPLNLAAMQNIVAAMIALPLGLAIDGNVFAAPQRVWEISAAMGVLLIAMTTGLQTVMQPKTTATHAGLIFSLESVWAAVAGVLLLGEVLTPRMLTGCVLIMLGIIWVELRRSS
jgi:drug/metabolite transporter (DMT)-like permease